MATLWETPLQFTVIKFQLEVERFWENFYIPGEKVSEAAKKSLFRSKAEKSEG